ncbi:hypothetical protein, partial [Litorimonas sp.]|uniref:hypothetical protein n=1 Tax=Litorimonas sp. TaxID=1892381 RepID=UPI003A87CC4E
VARASQSHRPIHQHATLARLSVCPEHKKHSLLGTGEDASLKENYKSLKWCNNLAGTSPHKYGLSLMTLQARASSNARKAGIASPLYDNIEFTIRLPKDSR